jgi:hypothetical protein
MKTKLLTIAMTAALMLTAMTKVQAQNFEGPCLPYAHGLNGHVTAFCGSTETQTVQLIAGTNWFSTYVDITLDDLKAALVAAVPSGTIVIKSKNQNVSYRNGRWIGQLNSLDLAMMYMITVGVDCSITLEGELIDPSTLTLTISTGANYVAFPYNENMAYANFLSNLTPSNGDVFKSKNQNVSYRGNRWLGQMSNLEPGKGYIYVSTSAEDKDFVFPSNAKNVR